MQKGSSYSPQPTVLACVCVRVGRKGVDVSHLILNTKGTEEGKISSHPQT